MAPLYFAELMYADYVVMLRIKWPCFLSKLVKIRAALLKLLAKMRGPYCIYIQASAYRQHNILIINYYDISQATSVKRKA